MALAASVVGCRSRGAACRPSCVPAPACCGGPAIETYSTPGVITTQVPTAATTTTVIPGPETYAPSMP